MRAVKSDSSHANRHDTASENSGSVRQISTNATAPIAVKPALRPHASAAGTATTSS